MNECNHKTPYTTACPDCLVANRMEIISLRAQLTTARQEIEKLELMAGDSTKFGMELINERDSLRGLVDEMAGLFEGMVRRENEPVIHWAGAIALILDRHSALKAGQPVWNKEITDWLNEDTSKGSTIQQGLRNAAAQKKEG